MNSLITRPFTSTEWEKRDELVGHHNRNQPVRIIGAGLAGWYDQSEVIRDENGRLKSCPVPCFFQQKAYRELSDDEIRNADGLFGIDVRPGSDNFFLSERAKIKSINNNVKLIYVGLEPYQSIDDLRSGYGADADILGTYSDKNTTDVPVSYFWGNETRLRHIRPIQAATAKNLVAWIFSNVMPQRAKLLEEFHNTKFPIDTNHDFDFSKAYPECNLNNRDMANQCIFSRYLFVMTEESQPHVLDYSTEKLWNVFASGAIPIVNGPVNIYDYIPPHSVIDRRDFKSVDDLRKHLEYLASNEEAYMKYHAWRKQPWPEMFRARLKMSYANMVCNMCVEVARRRILEKRSISI